MSSLLQAHGSYRKLVTFQLARLSYDLTVRFCDKFVAKYSRTHDQMVQAARSGVQNIAEGSKASATSKKSEMKLTNVARASLEELLLDYEDFLRQNGLRIWPKEDPRRKELTQLRLQTADQVSLWVKENHLKTKRPLAEIAANAILTLVSIACVLLKRQLAAQAAAFQTEGGFTERLYKERRSVRGY